MSFINKIVAFFGKKAEPEETLKPLQTERVGLKTRLLKNRKKTYEVDVAIMIDDQPHRMLKIIQEAYSRDQAAARVQNHLKFKVYAARPYKKK